MSITQFNFSEMRQSLYQPSSSSQLKRKLETSSSTSPTESKKGKFQSNSNFENQKDSKRVNKRTWKQCQAMSAPLQKELQMTHRVKTHQAKPKATPCRRFNTIRKSVSVENESDEEDSDEEESDEEVLDEEFEQWYQENFHGDF